MVWLVLLLLHKQFKILKDCMFLIRNLLNYAHLQIIILHLRIFASICVVVLA